MSFGGLLFAKYSSKGSHVLTHLILMQLYKARVIIYCQVIEGEPGSQKTGVS